MSVFIKGLNRIIKGMEMPKLEKTYKVRLYKAVDGRIIVTACGIKDNLLRPVGEAIEIPTPHGRLIDADFEEQHYTSMTTSPTPDVTEQDKHNSLVIVRALQMAKTVIEAEETE